MVVAQPESKIPRCASAPSIHGTMAAAVAATGRAGLQRVHSHTRYSSCSLWDVKVPQRLTWLTCLIRREGLLKLVYEPIMSVF